MDPDDHRSKSESGENGPLEDDEAVVDEAEGVRQTAVEEVDQRIVDLLSWILDTETRAKIYVHLLANPGSTSEEVAKGTGLYPSTVREALAELHDEERVTREKRASEGAGNNPYEYRAIQPSELVGGVVDQVQRELNTIFTLDRVLDRDEDADVDVREDAEPVTITVDETDSFPGEIRRVETEDSERDALDDSESDVEVESASERDAELTDSDEETS
ncbi:helix-turn-helix domain-containing protein [Natrarchaeobius oligotrophus]|uniref:Winged helix-turn-helix transcriptional regulator n=1 Tax=Natrarchaeobius chitinivorans TaxID=1679083 RepID=A0A3N6MM68_NATCH|nr:helix-turn-helix domain-containing protein [Natrarchaeobius chitinivorans]RQG98480.1 winged helix-turn-helix transcriptional regulator [Natrarchaeobius chitinivorans]